MKKSLLDWIKFLIKTHTIGLTSEEWEELNNLIDDEENKKPARK